jgi:hypothetical protein
MSYWEVMSFLVAGLVKFAGSGVRQSFPDFYLKIGLFSGANVL